MTYVKEFLDTYGMSIVYAILTALATYVAAKAKQFIQDRLEDKKKKDIAKMCVEAVEQMYKDLHGTDKYNKAAESIVEMLNENGIQITELELKLLIESTLSGFNKAFQKEYGIGEEQSEQNEEPEDEVKPIKGFAQSGAEE